MNNQQAVVQPAQVVAPAGALPADAPLAGAPLNEVAVVAVEVPHAPAKPAPLGAPAPADALPADAPLAGAPLVEVAVVTIEVPPAPAKPAPLGAPAPPGGPPAALVVAKPAAKPAAPVNRQITVHYANIEFDITVNGNTRYRDLRARILENPDSANLHNLRNLQGCIIEYHPAAVNAAVANANALIPAGTEHIYITEPSGKY
ncbi:hypothetical protein SAMD00019534_016220 [Acytostelium subglobosum LB1]|uniref:hypothetical protein n=1 Tax=Acytostelium subglobosum LB1 TaxID=1410327 RepID=UPI000644F2CA|nr:hypothetical protein SAMD00019534_016220 [Acytostelium subglobosum LB1]GAM18447.1 hypothetical protein SAMD00019534_016220 [Acytostelium subglobosum LB1]|eukprot:XP_012757667.1 hypothetical protein SAMD00019534_016220 [Acytostelium subglobosum LB1]